MTDPLMSCRQARNEAALSVGGDLDETSALRLERHLAVCPDCRRLRDEMLSTQDVLRAAGEAFAPEDLPLEPARPLLSDRPDQSDLSKPARPDGEWNSLWPGVSVRLDARERALRAPRFNGWAPFLAVTAACLLVAVLSSRNNVADRAQAMPEIGPGSPLIRANQPLDPDLDPRTGRPVEERPAPPDDLRDPREWDLLRPQETLFRLVPTPYGLRWAP